MLTDLVYIPFAVLQKFRTSGHDCEGFGLVFSLPPSADYMTTFSCFLFVLNEGMALFPSCTAVPSVQRLCRAGRQEDLHLLASPGNEQ